MRLICCDTYIVINVQCFSLLPASLSSSLSTSAMSLLYECVNTVIAGELWCSLLNLVVSAARIVNFSQISFYIVFH